MAIIIAIFVRVTVVIVIVSVISMATVIPIGRDFNRTAAKGK